MTSPVPFFRWRCAVRRWHWLALVMLGLPLAAPAHDENSVVIQQLSEKITASPNDPMLYLQRAEISRLSRHWHAAIPDYQRAAELDPTLALVGLAWACMYNDAGKPEQALPMLDHYLLLKPEDPKGYAERGRTKRLLKQWAAAAADCAAAVKFTAEPEPELFVTWADVLLDGGDSAQALAVLNQGIARLGAAVSLEMRALDLEQAMRQWDAALQRIEVLLAQPGRKDSLHVRKAQVLIAAGRLDEAHSIAELARKEFDALPEAKRRTPAGQQLSSEIDQILNPNKPSR